MLHRRYIILFTLLMACLSVMGQGRDIVIKDGAYYSTASLPVDTVHNQSFEKDSIYLIVPRDVQIAYPDYNNRAQLIIWQSGRPIYALPITQYDSLSYVRMLQGDTLRTIFSQQAGSLPSYNKRPIVWQHGQVTVTDSAQVLANEVYQSVAQGNYANFIIQPTEIVRDTQYILCIRDTVYKVQDIYDDTDDVDSIPSVDTIPPTPGRRIGVFSVAADKQVSFSQGNLQYTQSTDEWRFAREQYEYIGEGNLNDGQLANRIDLFGWSANNTTAPFGVSTSTNAADYAGGFVDWGTNTISGDAPNTWRTLSIAEWEYLLEKRPNAANLQGIAQVNGVNGLIILPDDWVCPLGINFVHGFHSDFGIDYFAQHQQFTLDQWIILEQSGAVFLPASKWRNGSTFTNSSEGGHYWSSTCGEISTNAHYLSFGSQEAWMNTNSLHRCFAVRLVHDTVVPQTIPDPCLVVKVNDTLSINMMCVEGGTFTMGDDNISNASPAHQVTLFDYYIGETEVTQALWKAVMGDIPTGNKNPSNPVGYVSYADCQNFIAKLNNLTGLNFQLPTEAEWEYAAMGGHKSHNYIYSGSNTIDDVAWYDQNSGNKMHNVGAKQPNELGIYDMSGNAWEWCADYHSKYTAENQINPQGPATGTDRVLRSGSFRTIADRCTNKHRQARDADYPDSHITLRLVLHDTTPEPPKRIGVFSVAADKQVSFSQGNLQYTQSTDEWRFAREQYEYIGADNIQNSALADKIDLFGWSSDSGKAPFGISTSQTAADYMGQFVDWGVNEIQGDAANTWRTLSQEEWNYIFENRKNAKQLYSKGSIDGVRGMIVLPDDWVQPQGLHFTADPTNLDMNLDINVYTAEQWQKMEEAGAVFLCPTGRRDGTEIGHTVWYGGYWSSSRSGEHVKHMYFNYNYEIFTTNYSSGDYSYGYNGRAVRLVHDTIVPPPAPCQTFKVNGVTFNMMCVEGEMYDYKIAQTEVTQGLWEQVMGYNNSLFKGEYLPVEKVSWEECQTFIQKLNEMTGKHFRLPTEAEWEYAARGGKNSRGSTYAGSNSIDSVAWYQSNSQEQTHTIATLMPNELGIYDMSGNVWEWCQDYYDASTQRVVRGGSFYDVASVCRISSRSGRDANYRSYIGLRLVLDEHEYVDLGLSVKWATTNVGAESAEEYGDYFAWGETETKDKYSWANYKWCDGTDANMTKYNATDGKTILELDDDAAYVNWGGKWRMPTDEEMTELREKCTWTWISINGVDGYEVTGPSGKSIFLPATGFYFVDGYKSYGNGDYWSTKATTTSGAYQLYFNSDHWSMSSSYRYFGFPIRPVYDDR